MTKSVSSYTYSIIDSSLNISCSSHNFDLIKYRRKAYLENLEKNWQTKWKVLKTRNLPNIIVLITSKLVK